MNAARTAERLRFAADALSAPAVQLQPASSDASARSYWRSPAHPGRLLMDSPPGHEPLAPWLRIAGSLAGLGAPAVLQVDETAGFALIEDFGDTLLLRELVAHPERASDNYRAALQRVVEMQTMSPPADLPDYSGDLLWAELELLPAWFLQRHLGVEVDPGMRETLDCAFTRLVDEARRQPQVFVHRDYHSRNLICRADGNLGVIDFQDAVRGPLCYDPVSLLRDCYIEWPQDRIDGWLEQYRKLAIAAGLSDADAATFRRWFDLIGLQRHLKVLGIFCRLNHRDGKSGYLKDLPLVWRYVEQVAGSYPEFRELHQLLRNAIDSHAPDLLAPISR